MPSAEVKVLVDGFKHTWVGIRYKGNEPKLNRDLPVKILVPVVLLAWEEAIHKIQGDRSLGGSNAQLPFSDGGHTSINSGVEVSLVQVLR